MKEADRMRGKTGWILAAVALLAGLLLGGLWLIARNSVEINGTRYPKDTQFLDLSGQSVEDMEGLSEFPELRRLDLRRTGITPQQIDRLHSLLPDCVIEWEVPFQGRLLSSGEQELTLTTLTMEDVERLEYLPGLTRVEAWECEDYGPLLALEQRHPGCQVLYRVKLGDASYDRETTALTLENAADPQLSDKLACFSQLQSVHFTGNLPDAQELLALCGELPQADISWEVQMGGEQYASDLTELSLSGSQFEQEKQLEDFVAYFPELRELRLEETELPPEAMLAIEQKYPGLYLDVPVSVGPVTVRRDVEEVDLSGWQVTDLAALEQRLALLPNLRKVIMCGCGISNEEMDALNRRYGDVRFVWEVQMGALTLRTDALFFAPNKYTGVEVSDETMENIRYCPDLICVDIGHADKVTDCSWAADLPHLRYLVLAHTGITDISPLAELKELVFLELFLTQVRDYSPLLGCTALEDLNLGYTPGDPEPLLEMSWLKRLWWTGGRTIDPAVREALQQALPDTQINFYGPSSTGMGWRRGQHYYDMRDLIGMPYFTD